MFFFLNSSYEARENLCFGLRAGGLLPRLCFQARARAAAIGLREKPSGRPGGNSSGGGGEEHPSADKEAEGGPLRRGRGKPSGRLGRLRGRVRFLRYTEVAVLELCQISNCLILKLFIPRMWK